MSPAFTTLQYQAAASLAPTLLVMLPGAGIEAADFAANGMIAAAQSRAPIDIIATRPPLDLYLDGSITQSLHETVIAPRLAESQPKLWLLGISLGGMGALLYAAAHAPLIERIFLIAPFLGTPGTIAAITAAGGLKSWSPTAITTAPETRLLTWLQHRPASPVFHLGFGAADRFAPGHRLLAATLPAETVFTTDGAHDWPTWRKLWHSMLAAA